MIKFFYLLLFLPYSGFCQSDTTQPFLNSKQKNGIKVGIIPVLSYDSDIGYRYGSVINLFDYGKAGKFPDYEQYLFLRFTNSTKGNSQAQLLLDSEKIIPETKVIFETSYLSDKLLDFFGFNGRNAVFQKKFTDPQSATYINKYFYAYERRMLRMRLDLQKYISGKKLRLLVGYTFHNFNINRINYKNLNLPERENKHSPDSLTLYEYYSEWKVIKPREKNGGRMNYLTFGLIYDTRNSQCNSTDGKWIDAMLVAAPRAISKQAFSKLILTFRQYHGFFQNKISIAWRVSSQTKLTGEIPFYMLPFYFDSRMNQDGIGGAFNLRGVMRNRISADGYLIGNFEAKVLVRKFKFLKQDFNALFAFCNDLAYITQKYQVNSKNIPLRFHEKLFMDSNQKLSASIGPGLYFIYNSNNFITVNYGIPLNKSDGTGGLYIGSLLLF